MLTALRSGVYFRTGLVIAALAVFALIAPPAVAAFGHGKDALYCLTDQHNGITKASNHNHLAQHPDENSAGGMKPSPAHSDHNPTCCALFLVTALAPNAETSLCLTSPGGTRRYAPETRYPSRGPDQLNRPPISSLSI